MTLDRNMASRWEGAGYVIPKRNPAHADPEWFQRDLDDQIEDPDVEPVDPLPPSVTVKYLARKDAS